MYSLWRSLSLQVTVKGHTKDKTRNYIIRQFVENNEEKCLAKNVTRFTRS